jgi:DNA repair exonuclease SbcCD ATPase subunit
MSSDYVQSLYEEIITQKTEIAALEAKNADLDKKLDECCDARDSNGLAAIKADKEIASLREQLADAMSAWNQDREEKERLAAKLALFDPIWFPFQKYLDAPRETDRDYAECESWVYDLLGHLEDIRKALVEMGEYPVDAVPPVTDSWENTPEVEWDGTFDNPMFPADDTPAPVDASNLASRLCKCGHELREHVALDMGMERTHCQHLFPPCNCAGFELEDIGEAGNAKKIDKKTLLKMFEKALSDKMKFNQSLQVGGGPGGFPMRPPGNDGAKSMQDQITELEGRVKRLEEEMKTKARIPWRADV